MINEQEKEEQLNKIIKAVNDSVTEKDKPSKIKSFGSGLLVTSIILLGLSAIFLFSMYLLSL